MAPRVAHLACRTVIPYIEIPPITFGPLRIHVWGLLVAIGLGVGYFSLRRRLQRMGLDGTHVPGALFWVLVGAVMGAALLSAITSGVGSPGDLLRIPKGAAYGGIAAGLAGGWLYLWACGIRGTAFVQTLDAMAFVLPRGWLFLRLGCALVHDHPGIPTDSWLGVQYPAGPRFDLGLLELLFTIAFLGILTFFDRLPRPPGFYCGFVPFAYGICRLVLEPLTEDPHRYFGWSLNLYFSLVAVAAGLAVLTLSIRRASRNGLPLPTR